MKTEGHRVEVLPPLLEQSQAPCRQARQQGAVQARRAGQGQEKGVPSRPRAAITTKNISSHIERYPGHRCSDAAFGSTPLAGHGKRGVAQIQVLHQRKLFLSPAHWFRKRYLTLSLASATRSTLIVIGSGNFTVVQD